MREDLMGVRTGWDGTRWDGAGRNWEGGVGGDGGVKEVRGLGCGIGSDGSACDRKGQGRIR